MKKKNFEYEDYYENSVEDELYEDNESPTNPSNNIFNKKLSSNQKLNHEEEEPKIQISPDDYEIEDQERIEMENDYQLVKCLNELKEKNKKLESQAKYQRSQIESLESELEKVLSENRLKEMELEENRSKNSNNPLSPEYKKQMNLMNQVNNLNNQLDKYKNLYNDKKNDFNGLLEKFNELQKIVDKYQLNEKKIKQEIFNKDKQISRLIEEVDKKSQIQNNYNSSKNIYKEKEEKEIERLNNEHKKLEKQKNELYVAFKKSIKLCSILKRQKVHLENARLLAFTEDEFKQLLEKEQNKI